MVSPKNFLFTVASTALLAHAAPAADGGRLAAIAACALVGVRPSLEPAFAGSLQYTNDISHWSNASSLPSLCSVQPNTPQEIQTLFSIIRQTRTPWAVKGKGHTNVNNASSTYGLQIAMTQFNQIELSPDKKSVKLGMGLDWAQVYTALDPHGVIVVGGRAPGVGVAGLTLSSGYAWFTNEYGFAIDNTLAADIVLPNGTFTTVSETHGADIFRGLQGGLNNFGIVTSITLKTFPLGQVWAGVMNYPGEALGALINITAEYSAKPSNPKATLATEFFSTNGSMSGLAVIFYDGPTPPPGLFDDFLTIPGASGTVTTRSFLDFILTNDVPGDPTNRATWYSAPILTWTRELLIALHDLCRDYSIKVAKLSRSGTLVSANVEPFGPQAYSFNRGSAWPHDPSSPYNTFNGLTMWSDSRDDKLMFDLTVEYHTAVWDTAVALGTSDRSSTAYFPPNYAQSITPSQSIYGPNMGWLKEVQRQVDPHNLISLTGGYKI